VPSDIDHLDEGPRESVVQTLHTLKQKALEDILSDLPPDEPVVVFARFRHDLDSIHAAARHTERLSSELSGRTKSLDDWQAGKTTVLAAQYRCGSIGIDLTRAHHCVLFSYTFSLEEYEQALARIGGPAQKEPTCFYHHLVVEQSIDQRIRKAVAERKTVLDTLLQREQA